MNLLNPANICPDCDASTSGHCWRHPLTVGVSASPAHAPRPSGESMSGLRMRAVTDPAETAHRLAQAEAERDRYREALEAIRLTAESCVGQMKTVREEVARITREALGTLDA